ncbi:STAS domain-containing protein [Nonomuraea sp. NPDC050451]|uniref:STAS domain-containing protein n=1 Tax=Nonomuraea sp. NPDC050451 TaxID=3364364 RepID=UPI0037A1BDA3
MSVLNTTPSAGPRNRQPTTVRLSGEIDIFTSKALRQQLLNALRHSIGPLVIDLSQVSFCDASGLAVLVGIQRRASARGISLALTAPQPYTSRLLHITGLDRSLPMTA